MSLADSKFIYFVCSLILLCVLFLVRLVESGSIVKFLPGFSGPLPFKLETGYVSVGETELFYLFVESQGKPLQDPVMVYLIGGPGCSALNGFLFQTGPLHFKLTDYEGGLPTLELYPYTWTKTASIIYLDLPVGSGYSYSNSSEEYSASDLLSANQTYMFMRQWLDDHPKFITNRFFIATDSYSGVIAPIIAQEILNGNKAGLKPKISLVGIISGSPHTDSMLEDNSKIPMAYQLALLSDGLYKSAKKSCHGDYIDVDSSNVECLEDLKVISECLELINDEMVLSPKCATVSPTPNGGLLLPSSRERDYWCKNFDYLLSDIWANDESVQRALHVREGTIKEWYRCNLNLSENIYTYDVSSSIDYHRNLTSTGLQILLYTGDHDLVVPHISTEYWISTLNLTVDEDWRPWFVDGQIAGFTLKYTNYGYRLTYATLKGSGHSPTEWMGMQVHEMFERWIHFYPL
ncbi:hypothetical protein Ddye_001531 [Dipteronia dyeriana]|uniref:Uncharacterized protein n=1 Tax=Dipteronia dyeriana TaxID=168575 RepID=A0AAD9XPG5_9ROSI|nr:hypothetical protein Ddye_001531 [Dipteronia dyeriana]